MAKAKTSITTENRSGSAADAAAKEKRTEMPLSDLHPFEGHPFKVLDDELMEQTVESIKQIGVVSPLIVRPDPEGGFEILSGHRRLHAAQLAGLETVPVIVKEMDDDAAIIFMVDSNLQRENILPSERAFSYKMKLEAMKHQGQRGDLTSDQVGQKSWAVNQLADDANESKTQVQRFIRLTNLIPEILDMVDEDIRAKLIQSGVPEEEIAFIHDADTEAKKKDLFAKVRTGQVRVLLGSTQKMGAGTNVQDRLVAVHHLDVGWRPADMTQRNGRIIRQGNRNKEVQVYQYVTEGTFDAYLYQTLENKQKFISQIMTSKSPVRSCDDVDEQALSYAEIKALCAGDPQIKEKMDLDVDVARLKVLKADHQSQQYRLEDKLMKYFPAEIEKTQGFIKGFQSDIRTVAAHPLPEEGFCGMEVNGTRFTEKAEAGEGILAICKANQSLEPVPLGSYRGFKMELAFDSFQKEYQVLLKGEMTHRVPIGTSAAGNIQRLDNALAGIPARLEKAEQQLDNLRSQQEAAQAELGKPFPQEAELAKKSARLAELDALLNMDDRGNDDPDREKTTEKPSVLAELRDRVGRIPPMTHRDDEEVTL